MVLKTNEDAAKWVAYLHGLGPTSSNTNAFDEWLTRTVRKTGICPVEIGGDFDDEIVKKAQEIVSNGQSAVLLLTGMAGDGKTRMARVLWESLAQQAANKGDWDNKSIPRLEMKDNLGNPYTVTFVKDLSGDMTGESEQERDCKMITEVPYGTCRVIACNHGRLLERIRQENNEGTARLADDIEKKLFERNKSATFQVHPGYTIYFFDLSVFDPSDKFEQILGQICGRSEWQKCRECQCHEKCAIDQNRRVLWDDEKHELKTPAKRQAEIIRLIGCNGVHLPIRDLLIVASNDILGSHSLASPRKKKRLLTCADVLQAYQAGEPTESYVFANLLGENILPADRKKNIVFREFPRFGIGDYAPRQADNMLTESNTLKEFSKTTGNFIAQRLWGLNSQYEQSYAGELLRMKRQALFFVFPDNNAFKRWSLTAFSFGGQFVGLLSKISQPHRISPQLVKGMNRVFTGQFVSENKDVLVTTAGTNSKTMQGELLRCEIRVKQLSATCGVFVMSNKAGLPIIHFAEPDVESINYPLTPLLFEFFMRMGSGYVPESFSKECLSQAFQLKFKLIKHFAVDNAEDAQEYDELSLQTLSIETGAENNITVKI